jgi:hypothetical protein
VEASDVAQLRKRSFSKPDRVLPSGRGRVDVVTLGDIPLWRITYEPGWRWTTDVKPMARTRRCALHHVGAVVSGRLGVELEDGSSLDIGPGDAFEIPPGHEAWVIGDEPWVAIDAGPALGGIEKTG